MFVTSVVMLHMSRCLRARYRQQTAVRDARKRDSFRSFTPAYTAVDEYLFCVSLPRVSFLL